MRLIKFTLILSLSIGRCLWADSSDSAIVKIDLMPNQIKALLVAIDRFQGLPYLTNEQRKLENYKVRIRSGENKIEVNFIAIPRPGDELAIGGKLPYAHSVGVVVNTLTFSIEEVYESK